jgi:hypothetical protein
MFEPRDSDKDLADDIGFGLWRHGRLKIPIEACRLIGAAVVAHCALPAGGSIGRDRTPRTRLGEVANRLSPEYLSSEHFGLDRRIAIWRSTDNLQTRAPSRILLSLGRWIEGHYRAGATPRGRRFSLREGAMIGLWRHS